MKGLAKLSLLAAAFALIAGCSVSQAEKVTITDAAQYNNFFGPMGAHRDVPPLPVDIFPVHLPESASVEQFTYSYYFDEMPCYTSLLVLTCDEQDYQKEIDRLSHLQGKAADTLALYGVTGFPEKLCAQQSSERGIVYAMTEPADRRLVYAEITFDHYHSDMDYQKIIGKAYLPLGFDAGPENATRLRLEKQEGQAEGGAA